VESIDKRRDLLDEEKHLNIIFDRLNVVFDRLNIVFDHLYIFGVLAFFYENFCILLCRNF